MTKIEKVIVIKASVEDVFNFTSNWENSRKFQEGLHNWMPTTEKTGGKGARFSYWAKPLGTKYEIETEITDEVENKSRTYASIKGPKTRGQWFFEAMDGGTRITYIVEYQLPIPIVGGILDRLFVKPKREAYTEKVLQNLKALFER